MKNDHQNRPHDSFFEDILEKGSLEKYTTNKHHFFDIEIDANKRAAKYFYNGENWPYERDGYPLSINRIVLL